MSSDRKAAPDPASVFAIIKENHRLRAAARAALSALNAVPIVTWPRKVTTRSGIWLCCGCDAKDDEDCKPGCWVAKLEAAVTELEFELGVHRCSKAADAHCVECGAEVQQGEAWKQLRPIETDGEDGER